MSQRSAFLRTRVARRILGLFVLCAVLPVVLLATVVYRHVSEQLLDRGQARLVESSQTVSMELAHRLQGIASAFERASVSVELRPREWAPATVLRPSLRDQGIAALVVERDERLQMLVGRPGALPELQPFQRRHLLSGRPALLLDSTAAATRIWMVRSLESPNALLWAEIDPSILWGGDSRSLAPAEKDLCVLAQGYSPLYCTRPLAPEAVRQEFTLRPGTLEWENAEGRYIAGYAPISLTFDYGTPNWTVVLSESSSSVLAPLAAFQRTFVLVILLSLLAVGLISNLQISRSLKPLEQLREGTRRLASEDFSQPVVVVSGDEFADLAASFNAMTDRLRLSFGALQASHRIDQVALATPDEERIVEAVLEQARDLVRAPQLAIALADSRPTMPWRIRSVARGGWFEVLLDGPAARHLDGPDSEIELSAIAAASNPMIAAMGAAAENWLLIPLRHRGSLAGVLVLGADATLSSDSRAVAHRLADQLAMALSHAALFRELDDLGWGALRALARAIDANSPWTAGHSERVAMLSTAIGRELGLGARDLDRLHRGGLLHDIGKIGVPPEVLNKAGRLTPGELDKVRAHPALGAKILAPIQAYEDLLPLVLSHHELLDGSGYPDGLTGDRIPQLVRILTVADVFDALVSDRPYRGAWNPRKAIDYIAGGSGITFDPVVTSAFHELLKRGSPDLWQAYPALESQLARDAGFARSRGPRPSVFVS